MWARRPRCGRHGQGVPRGLQLAARPGGRRRRDRMRAEPRLLEQLGQARQRALGHSLLAQHSRRGTRAAPQGSAGRALATRGPPPSARMPRSPPRAGRWVRAAVQRGIERAPRHLGVGLGIRGRWLHRGGLRSRRLAAAPALPSPPPQPRPSRAPSQELRHEHDGRSEQPGEADRGHEHQQPRQVRSGVQSPPIERVDLRGQGARDREARRDDPDALELFADRLGRPPGRSGAPARCRRWPRRRRAPSTPRRRQRFGRRSPALPESSITPPGRARLRLWSSLWSLARGDGGREHERGSRGRSHPRRSHGGGGRRGRARPAADARRRIRRPRSDLASGAVRHRPSSCGSSASSSGRARAA